MMTIGIFGSAHDREVHTLNRRLLNRGVESRIVDLSLFPRNSTITIEGDDIVIDGKSLFEMDAAFLRSRGINLPDFIRYEETIRVQPKTAWEDLYIPYCRYVRSEKQYQCIRNAVLASFTSRRKLINSLEQNDLHRLKTHLCLHLYSHGVRVPQFMAATSSKALSPFIVESRRRSKHVVTKPMAGIYKTKLYTEEEPRGNAVFYQHYVKGDTVRCYVLDDELIASAVVHHSGSVDSSVNQTGIDVISLPRETVNMVRYTAGLLGLCFCGIDLIREEDTGEYFVVDVNISPMFVNFARQSFIDIPALIADCLIGYAQKQRGIAQSRFPMLEQAKDILSTDPDIRKLIRPEG